MATNWDTRLVFRYFLYLMALLALGSIWLMYYTDGEIMSTTTWISKSLFLDTIADPSVDFEDVQSDDEDNDLPAATPDPLRSETPSVLELLSTVPESEDLPVIRSWTKFFSNSLSPVLVSIYNRTDCKYKCRFLERHEVNGTSTDAYIFHSRNINPSDLPRNRTSNQLFVLFGLESAYNFGGGFLKLPSNYFNVSSTYRMDSDYPFPYFSFIPLKEGEKPMWTQEEIVEKLKNRTGVTVINSHCITKSRREDYIEELSEYINITAKGACYKNDIPNCPRYGSNGECLHNFLSKFKFYLAFENGVCQDYVTEKFSYLTQMLVPIVLQRSALDNVVPKDEKAFIAADDFATPEELAAYLSSLEENDSEYLKYFEWVDRYRLDREPGGDSICKLCEDLHKLRANQLETKILPNAKKFVMDDAKCNYGYAKALLPVKTVQNSTEESSTTTRR